MTQRTPSLLLAATTLAALHACSSFRASAAGTLLVNGDEPSHVRVEVPADTGVTIELWNEGPADARFELLQTGSDEMVKGVLPAGGKPFRWAAAAPDVELTITATGRAMVGYRVRDDDDAAASSGR